MKIIGVVGSRKRDSFADARRIKEEILRHYSAGDWLCSGDCNRGADAIALSIARKLGIPILLFPPGNIEPSPQKFFIRNNLIAEQSTILIARVIRFDGCEQSGGTWYTVRKWKEFHPYDEHNLILIEDNETNTN